MKSIYRIVGIIMVIESLLSGSTRGADAPAVVPQPREMQVHADQFELTSESRIVLVDASLKPAAEYLAGHLRPATGFDLPVVTGKAQTHDITFNSLSFDGTLGEEAYGIN